MKILKYKLNYVLNYGYNRTTGVDYNIKVYCHSLDCGEGATLYPEGYPDSGNGPLYLILPDDNLVNEEYSIHLDISSKELVNEYDLIINGVNSKFFKELFIFSSDGIFNIRSLEIQHFTYPVNIKMGNITNLKYSGESILFRNSYIAGGLINGPLIKYLSFEDTNLGKLSFNNLNITKLKIFKSNISKVELNNVNISEIIEKELTSNELKELYRHLKYLFDSIGNKTEANKFFAKEMEYHMKTLKKSGNTKDYWIARLQKEISDFGNDWVLASYWYFIVSGIGFLLALSGTVLWYNYTGDIGEKNLYEIFLMYINPLPKIDEVPGLWYLLVSITKILIVYQIVVALRRISQR